MIACLRRASFNRKILANARKRLFSSPSTPTEGIKSNIVKSTPPFVARVAIVGTSVGLASPLFAVGGVGALWFSYLPKTAMGRFVKYGVAVIIGGGFTSVIVKWVVPFLGNNSDFIMPFAAANAIAASFWYSIGEVIYGNAVMAGRMSVAAVEKNVPFNFLKSLLARFGSLGIPIAGPVIGALTAISAPFLWPFCLRSMWNKDTQDMLLGEGDNGDTWLSHAYEWILVPVGLPVGILSGTAMHLLLSGAVAGVPGKPWTKTSLPVMVTLVGVSAVYFTFFRSNPNDLVWYVRTDPFTGADRSYNARTGEYISDNGRKGRIMDFRRVVMKGVTTVLRDPLQAVRLTQYFDGTNTSIDSDETYHPRTQDNKFNVQHIDEDEKVHRLLDVLVRYKYLQLQSESGNNVSSVTDNKGKKKSIVDSITVKFAEQCQALGVATEDLPHIMRELEILVVQQRKGIMVDPIPAVDHTEKTHDSKNKHSVNITVNIQFGAPHEQVDRLVPRSVLAKYLTGRHDNGALTLLVRNLKLLEDEYRERLHYVITEEKGAELLQERRQEAFWRESMFYAAVVGTAAMIAGGVAAVLQSK